MDVPVRLATAEAAMHAVSRFLAAVAAARTQEDVERAIGDITAGLLEARAVVVLAALEPEPTFELRHCVGCEPSAGPVAPQGALEFLGRLRAGEDLDGPFDGEAASAVSEALGTGPGCARAVPIPFRHDGVLSHVMVVMDPELEGIEPSDPDVGATLANAAASSLAQMRMIGEHEARLREQDALARAAKSLNETLDLQTVLTRICTEAAGLMGGDQAAVWRGTQGDPVAIEAVWGFPPEAIGMALPSGAGMAGAVMQTGEPRRTNDYQSVARDLPADSPFFGTRSCIAVPMHWDGAMRGVLAVGSTAGRIASPDNLVLLETFAEIAAAASRNASAHAGLAHAARTDGLTGCMNHAALQEALTREVERCVRVGGSLSLVLLDLDDFKAVNEEHGHLVGDEVLRRVGHVLRQAVRPYDSVARYGGDEFAILTTDADENQACEVARRAIERLANTIEDVREGALASASAGIATWSAGLSATDLVAQADRALLFGKQEGRTGAVIRASGLPETFRPGRFRRRAPAGPSQAAPAAQWPADRGADAARLRKRSRQLALATALGMRLSALIDPAEITRVAVEELHRAFGYYLTCVVRIREDGYVEAASEHGPALGRLKERDWSQPLGDGVIGRCLREHTVIISGDVASDPDYVDSPETMSVRSELCAPLWVGEELWGAVDIEETRPEAFDEDDARLVQTVADQVGSALRSALLYQRLEGAYLGTAEALAGALEVKDSGIAAHSRSIATVALTIGSRLGMEDAELEILRYAAFFHDIGKIAIPDHVLSKSEPLTVEERAQIEDHSRIGAQILRPIEFLHDVVPIVRHEHESFDGSGYPAGLSGGDIPLGSRIILACDAYHAMISERPYRPALSHEQALAELRAGSGTQFDPQVVEELMSVIQPPLSSSR